MPSPLRLLHVEDEPDIREIAELVLDRFELTQCESGLAALALARDLELDVILLDVMMPGMDGMETLTELRKLPHLAHTPVIFMTARVQPAEVAQLLDLGAVAVIAKPFDPIELEDEVLAAIAKTAGAPRAP